MAEITETPRDFKATGFQLFWRTLWARAYPRLVGSLRETSWMFFETVLPLMSVAAFVFVYRAIEAPPEYVGFVVVGGAMTAFWLNVLWSMGSQLYWDKDMGNLELYVLSPGPLMGILVGMSVGGLVFAGTRAAVILVICSLLFNVSYATGSLLLIVVVFILTMVSLYGLGMMFSSIFLISGREGWHISNMMQEPIYLVSGFYFPVQALGTVVASAASILPLTLGLDAMRQLLFVGGAVSPWLSVVAEVSILAVMCVVYLVAAWIILGRLEMIGRREGRLIERRR